MNDGDLFLVDDNDGIKKILSKLNVDTVVVEFFFANDDSVAPMSILRLDNPSMVRQHACIKQGKQGETRECETYLDFWHGQV